MDVTLSFERAGIAAMPFCVALCCNVASFKYEAKRINTDEFALEVDQYQILLLQRSPKICLTGLRWSQHESFIDLRKAIWRKI